MRQLWLFSVDDFLIHINNNACLWKLKKRIRQSVGDDTLKKEEDNKGCLGKCGCLFLIGLYSLRFFIFDVDFHGYYISYKGAFLSTMFTIR